jgi:PAS domain S-box-containing protein
MKQTLLNKLSGVPVVLETLGKDKLLAGFLLLLFLISFTGYWGQKSLEEVEARTAEMRATNAHHLRIALEISRVAGEMAPEVRAEIGTKGHDSLLYFPAVEHLRELKREMDALFDEGQKSSLGSLAEFRELHSAFKDFWAAVNSDDPLAQGWDVKRDRMDQLIQRLEDYTGKERELTEQEGVDLTRRARLRIWLVTGAVLFVGVVVTALTFLEIRGVLGRLGRAYRESAESSDHLQSLLDSLVSGVVVIGDDGLVSNANKTFLASAGITEEEATGKHYREIFALMPTLADVIGDELQAPARSNRYCGRIERDGGRLFDVYDSPLLIRGEQRGAILVFVDVTENQLAQMELLRNRALSAVGQMTAQVAHEIRNPLGSINLALNLLKRRASKHSDEEREVIAVMESSVGHLGAIVTELLEFSRPKELSRGPVNLNSLLDGILPMVADRSRSKSITIEKEYDEDLPDANYDEPELRKLFINLIINAIDASDKGGIVQLRTRRDGPGNLVVEVADSGCGMDSETIRRLYEPFFTTKSKGTGLGMSIARKITELHRGDLSVRSKKGVGTTMTVRLPLEYSEAERQPVGRSTASQQTGSYPG